MLCHFVLFKLYTFLSPWLDNYDVSDFQYQLWCIVLYLAYYMMMIYISDFFIFMFQYVFLMLLLLYMFKILKKMHVFSIFNVCRFLSIFSPMLPRSCNQDPRRFFVEAEFFNIGFEWLSPLRRKISTKVFQGVFSLINYALPIAEYNRWGFLPLPPNMECPILNFGP